MAAILFIPASYVIDKRADFLGRFIARVVGIGVETATASDGLTVAELP
jgi:hypothetical protein